MIGQDVGKKGAQTGFLFAEHGLPWLARAIRAENPSIDEGYDILSFHADFIRNNFAKPEVAEAVKRAFGLGAVMIMFNGRKFACLEYPSLSMGDQLAERITELASALTEIAGHMEPSPVVLGGWLTRLRPEVFLIIPLSPLILLALFALIPFFLVFIAIAAVMAIAERIFV